MSNIIVKEIGDMFLDGKSVEEIMAWAEKEVDHYATYFFADTLTKERGRHNAVKRLLTYVDELAVDIKNRRVIIGHTDALEIAQSIGEQLKDKYGSGLKIEYVPVNPTAGSHCGPDTVGIAFYAKHR